MVVFGFGNRNMATARKESPGPNRPRSSVHCGTSSLARSWPGTEARSLPRCWTRSLTCSPARSLAHSVTGCSPHYLARTDSGPLSPCLEAHGG